MGVIASPDEKSMKELADKIRRTVRIKTKEPSIKIMIGKESMENEKLLQNVETIYNAVINALPKKKENVKSVMIKLSMNKPVKIIVK